MTPVGARQIRWRSAGSGSPTVVLEAGLTASASQWTTIQPRLAETTRVVAMSRAGYGGSTPVGRRDAHASVADFAVVLDQVDGPLVLVGHSWGGLLARLYTAAHPHRVAGLVLVDATHEGLAMMRARRSYALGQLGMSLAGMHARSGLLRKQLLAGRGALGPAMQSLPEELRAGLIEELTDRRLWRQARLDIPAVTSVLRELHARPLPAPTVPVVALVGARADGREAKSRRVMLTTYEAWVATLPDGRLVWAPHSGHLVPHEDEDLLVEVVEELVAEVSATPGPHLEG